MRPFWVRWIWRWRRRRRCFWGRWTWAACDDVYVDSEYDFEGRLCFEEWVNFEWCIEVSGDSVVHNDKLSFWGHDFESFVGEEFIVLYWFVEVAVVEDNGAGGVGLGEGEVVVEDEFEGGVAGEVTFHLDAAVDRGVDHVAWGVEEDVYFLVDVDENLVGVVLADRDRGGRGVDGARAEDGELSDFFYVEQAAAGFGLDYFAGDEGFDVRGVGELGVSEVDDLVEDFID